MEGSTGRQSPVEQFSLEFSGQLRLHVDFLGPPRLNPAYSSMNRANSSVLELEN